MRNELADAERAVASLRELAQTIEDTLNKIVVEIDTIDTSVDDAMGEEADREDARISAITDIRAEAMDRLRASPTGPDSDWWASIVKRIDTM